MKQVKVKIVKGVYGHDTGKTIVGKSASDAPFLLDADKAERLFRLGVAVPVDAEPIPEEPAEGENADEAELRDLNELTMDELKEVAAEYGVKYKAGTKKADFIEQIQAAIEEAAQIEAEAEEPAEGEEPFTYDPAEVVQ